MPLTDSIVLKQTIPSCNASQCCAPLAIHCNENRTTKFCSFVASGWNRIRIEISLIFRSYTCRLEPLRSFALEDFLAADKTDLAHQWLSDQRFASEPAAAALILQLLLDFQPLEPQLWAVALRNAAQSRAGPASKGLLGRAVRFARRNLLPAAWRWLQEELGPELADMEQEPEAQLWAWHAEDV